ncbi:MAG: biotin--[acetyl-CoA-carboxylase] ligase [candidate division Zixibacteria bacterium]|nr:biotin--[acetyl-CoA-carboxylase] ligase [candidate division Zixibacteria bacterium]
MKLSSNDGKLGPPVDILAFLKKNSNRFTSSREISEALSITRHIVYDSISFLRNCGYTIEASRNLGYKLLKSPDSILPVEIAAGLSCQINACRIFSYKSVDSTNITAHNLAKCGMPEGTLIIADSQKKGRGRMGRKWHSPSGKGLYFSLILRPKLPPDKIAGLSLATGLALTRAINIITGFQMQMKWPNDILYKKKKLAGILVELVAELDKVEYMIVGIGINVNHTKRDFPLSLQLKSTSLKMISRNAVSRVALLQEVLVQFESLYKMFCLHGFRYLRSELIKHSAVIGKRVALKTGKQKITGRAVGFDDMGGLIVKSKKGLRSYSAGDVSFR